jgi:hypothetical protein
MSYKIDGSIPKLLAGAVDPRTWYLSIGTPQHGIPEDTGYTEDELEVEVLVQAAWKLRQTTGPVIVTRAFSDCLSFQFVKVVDPQDLVTAIIAPRYCRLGDVTIAIATSIPSLRYGLSVLGPNSAVLCGGVSSSAARLSLVEDGVAVRRAVGNNDLQTIAARLNLGLDQNDSRIADNPWVVDLIDGYETWTSSVLLAVAK